MKSTNLNKLTKIADHLDDTGQHAAAEKIDSLLKTAQTEPTGRMAVLEKELLHIRKVCLEERKDLEDGIAELDATTAGIDSAVLEKSEERLEAELRHIRDLCLKEREALKAGLILQDESIASINKALGEAEA